LRRLPAVNFPILRGVQAANGGGSYDAFVSKFTRDGRSLIYSTYLGGSDFDRALGASVGADDTSSWWATRFRTTSP